MPDEERAPAVSGGEPRDVARLREAFASLSYEGSPETVDAERIFDALHGGMSPEERQAVVDELLVNPAVAQAWQLAREMSVQRSGEPLVGTALERSTPVATRTWMSMAAAIILMCGVGWQFISWRAQEPVYRSGETQAIESALAPGAVLSRAEPVLRWTDVKGARYRVRVLTPELDVLEESEELQAREYRLSDETLRRIAPGNSIVWQVVGRVPGEAVIVSPTFTVPVP